MKTILESKRIRFVAVSESLIGDYLAMVNDYEHVGRLIGIGNKVFSEEKERAWVRTKLEEQAAIFSMIDKESGCFIGNIEYVDIHDGTGELGISITAAMQDRGFGTEAIRTMVRYGTETLGLQRIVLKVYPFNERAIHVYESCGFQEYDRSEKDIFMEWVGSDGIM